MPEAQVSELPDEVGFEQGALLGIAGITAHQVVESGDDLVERVAAIAPDGVDHLVEAARDLSQAIKQGWVGLPVGARFPLDQIAAQRPTRSLKNERGRGASW